MPAILTLTLIYFAAQPLSAQAPARTKVEQRLAELLTPRAKAGSGTLPANPPPRKLVPTIDRPELPLKSTLVLPPAPPKPPGKPVQPRSLSEEPPLLRAFSQPETPQAVTMATAPLIRLWTWNVNEPLPLPILGAAVLDRASLADTSLESSVAAALAKLNPARTQPAAFQPQNLPDPFENRQAVGLRNPPEEIEQPPLFIRPLGR